MKLCIEPTAEGFLVYMDGEENYGEPLASVDEALEMARSMLGGSDQMAPEAEPMMDGEEEFVQGFQGATGY